MREESKGGYIFLAILLLIVLLINFLLMAAVNFSFVIIEIIAIIGEYFTIKKLKKIKGANEKTKKQEDNLLNLGYTRVARGLFLDEKNRKINILGKDYDFSQIVDCELVEISNAIGSTYARTNGKIKNNGKVKTATNSLTAETTFCNEMYINITIDDLNNPCIKFDVRDNGVLAHGSKKYRENKEEADRIIATLKLIKSK